MDKVFLVNGDMIIYSRVNHDQAGRYILYNFIDDAVKWSNKRAEEPGIRSIPVLETVKMKVYPGRDDGEDCRGCWYWGENRIEECLACPRR